MAYNRSKHRRTKLKRHDQGQDRHNKVLAAWRKQARLEAQKNQVGKGKRKRSK